nr:60S ribosomal protein L7A [Cryptomonas sp.]
MSVFSKKANIQKNKTLESRPHVLPFESRRKCFRTGLDIQPKKDLTRFVKWPLYIQIQRERKILRERLKIPPMINQFASCLDRNMTKQLLLTLLEYKNTSPHDDFSPERTYVYMKHGINTVTNLVQKKKALFVVIANDVNPIELVVWLPTLCQKMDIPYCIIKNKSSLGKLVGKKKTSCVAVTSFPKIGLHEMEKLIDCFRLNFNSRYEESRRRWGGGLVSRKTKV